MAKKAKWLEESTNKELLEIVAEVLEGEMDKKDLNRSKKAVAELIERTPEDTGKAGITVLEALEAAKASLEDISAAYQAELDAMEEDEADSPAAEDPEDDEEDVSDDEEEDSDYEEVDYTDWTLKELKDECRARGIKVTKGAKKSELIKALEADDEE